MRRAPMQALDRTQTSRQKHKVLGQTLTRDYKRRGTTTLSVVLKTC